LPLSRPRPDASRHRAPGRLGLDVLREIRQADGAATRFDPQLPIIVLSGRTADIDRVRGLEEGADDYGLPGMGTVGFEPTTSRV
jgi:CheY-like chemotaxis protein